MSESRSFQIIREGDEDPGFVPEPIDKRPIVAWLVDREKVSEAKYNSEYAAYLRTHALPGE